MENLLNKTIYEYLEHEVEHRRILVIGDLMLDRYLYGDVRRISPEAPVPVNTVREIREVLGGAANVAKNLASLGCRVFLAGVIGKDHYSTVFQKLTRQAGLDVQGVVQGRALTTTKIRILGGHQQMLRLDFEETEAITEAVRKILLNACSRQFKQGIDAVVISDYAKGVCTSEVCQSIIHQAREMDIPIFVDPKGEQWGKYRGATYVTPNVREISAVIGRPVANEDAVLSEASARVKEAFGIENIVVTRSEKGISVFSKGKIRHLSTVAKDVYDVSGAGDTVIAALAASISGNMNIFAAAGFANFAAGIEVGKVGTYAVTREELLCALEERPAFK